MVVLLLLSIFFFGSLIVLVSSVMLRTLKSGTLRELSPDWLSHFRPSKYEGMHSLLSDDDFGFLVRQPGFQWTLYRKFRRERLRIFREYLDCMVADFHRVHALASLLIAQNQVDQSNVASRLLSLRFRFFVTMLEAEGSYYISFLGLHTLRAQHSLAVLHEMMAELSSLQAQHVLAPSAA